MNKEFIQIDWGDQLADDCRQLVRLAVREDLDRFNDWTTLAIVPDDAKGSAAMVTRKAGVVAGLAAVPIILDEMDIAADWQPLLEDGAQIDAGTVLGNLSGPARHLLTAERLLLNFVSHLSGIATLTSNYVSAVANVADSQTRIYDTRKTTPGWRRLEKYAVHRGGGMNHRTGLFDAILIKDNHLAFASDPTSDQPQSTADAVKSARHLLDQLSVEQRRDSEMIVEVEVDTLEQLREVLPAGPDIVLLDNMSLDQLRDAVAVRNEMNPSVELEASGGVNLNTVQDIARTNVERISVGALTHAAAWLDIGLDWS